MQGGVSVCVCVCVCVCVRGKERGKVCHIYSTVSLTCQLVSRSKESNNLMQGVVTPIGVVVTAKTGVKRWSTGQGVFLPLVKGSRTIFAA